MNSFRILSPLGRFVAALAVCSLVLSLGFANYQFAYAIAPSTNVTSVTVDGSSVTTVAPGDTVSVEVTVVLTGSAKWKRTQYTIQGQSPVCLDTPDYDGGVGSNTFSVTAPASAGAYDLTIGVTSDNGNCNTIDDTSTLSDAIVVEEATPETGSITILKDTDGAGEEETFNFTSTLGNFSLLGDASDSQAFSELEAGVYAITESAKSGWSFDSVSCNAETYSATNPLSITLGEGEDVICTFSNSLDEVGPTTGTITISKTLIKDDNEGSETEDSFTYRIDGDPVDQGVAIEVEAGGHTLSEDVFSGYDQSAWGGHCAEDGTITVVAGEDYTCSITNDDEAIIESLGSIAGSKFNFDTEDGIEGWTIFLDENDNQTLDGEELSTQTTADGSYIFNNLQPNGTYTVCEVSQTGWTQISPEGCFSVELTGTAKNSVGNDFVNQQEEVTDIDLSIIKEVALSGYATPDAGDTIVYTITVTNNSVTDAASNVVVTDTLPSGLTYSPAGTTPLPDSTDPLTWNLGTIGANSFEVITLAVVVGGDQSGESISNEASVDATETDPNLENNSSTEVINVEGEGGGEGDTTTLTVIKHVINGPVSTSVDNDAADFNLTVSHGGEASTTVVTGSESGVTIQALTGAYEVTEGVYEGYSSTSLSADCSGTLTTGQDKTCTVTNEQDRYHIIGTIWHDEDEDGVIDEGEDIHVGWTIHARQGDDDITAVTDENGEYTIDVPRGTWTISPDYPSGWEGVPGDTSHTYTLPDDLEYTMGTTNESLFAKFWNAFIPTAHAALMGTIGGVNFGTKVAQGNGGGNGGGGGGGNGIYVSLSGNGGGSVAGASDDADNAPSGAVLGEATSILPAYAPNTGAGGAATSPLASLFAILGMLMSLMTIRNTRIG